MVVCERCWEEARKEAFNSRKSVAECYAEILEKWEGKGCPFEDKKEDKNEEH